jgi:polyphosphate kinase
MREKYLTLIGREIENAKEGKTAKIIWKLNSLVDPVIISALYETSNSGVEIKLIVRGICCLVPGLENLSTNIEVRSIVGRFLEHSRVFYFYNDGNEDIYLSSADMMQRNLDRRVEVTFPIEDPVLKQELIKTVVKYSLRDNVKTRKLNSDGTYTLLKPQDGEKRIISQEWLMNHALKSKNKNTKVKV